MRLQGINLPGDAHDTPHHARLSSAGSVRSVVCECSHLKDEGCICRWDELKMPEYLSVNPSGLVPVLEDGDVKMQESGAITQFLAEKYGQGRVTVEPGTQEHAAYCQVKHLRQKQLALWDPTGCLSRNHGVHLIISEGPERLFIRLILDAH